MIILKQIYRAHRSAVVAAIGLGVSIFAWVVVSKNLSAKGSFDYQPNVATLKGSPYGKVLGMAVQGPISFYWHEGQSHDDSKHLSKKDGVEHECGAGCTEHDHHEPEVHVHTADCAHGVHDVEESVGDVVESTLPWHTKARDKIKELSAYTHRRTNKAPLSLAHRQYLQDSVEDKLKLAHELDPTNFINYSNYHFFLSMSDIGRATADAEKALLLARTTMAVCQQEESDPAPWATASSAAYDIVKHMHEHPASYTDQERVFALNEFNQCVKEYDRLINSHLDSGNSFSSARLAQMSSNILLIKKLGANLSVYMNR